MNSKLTLVAFVSDELECIVDLWYIFLEIQTNYYYLTELLHSIT